MKDVVRRFKWGEIALCHPGFALDYTAGEKYDQRRAHLHLHLLPLSVFIYVPWKHTGGEHCFDRPSWGFYYHADALVLKWGKWSKFLYMPWTWEHIRHDVLMADGSWKRVAKGMGYDGRPWDWADKWQEEHEYHYCLRSWKVQERVATIGVEEREWRWRWFKWLPFPRKIRRSITVSFNDEVGERSGSWKGGTVGCGYDLRKDETPLECLRRMERERKFR
jgi:hypothetical protein